jgi:hypothetical protein
MLIILFLILVMITSGNTFGNTRFLAFIGVLVAGYGLYCCDCMMKPAQVAMPVQ